MKKLLLLTLPLLLCSCSSQPKYETHIYCDYRNTCVNCEEWDKDVDYSSAYSVTCEELTLDSFYPHRHYCVTYIHY